LRVVLPAPADKPSADRAVHEKVWSLLQAADPAERDAVLGQLTDAVSAPAPRPGDLPMDAAQLALLAASDWVEIGAHSVSHARLSALEPRDQRREIEESRDACEAMLQRPVTGFAYPFGAVGADTRRLAREAGFSYACTTRSACVRANDDIFDLPRVQAADEDGEALLRRLGEA
jgi:peptidoglycan/xylan/chitin deacetylase (PgdA/CDA1 family)